MADSRVVYERKRTPTNVGAETLFNIVEGERKQQAEIEKTKAIEGFRNEFTLKRDAALHGFNTSLEELRSGLTQGREEAAHQRSVVETISKGRETLGAAGTVATGMAGQGFDMGSFVNPTPDTDPATGQVMGVEGYTPKAFEPRSSDFVTKVLGEHVTAQLQQQGARLTEEAKLKRDLIMRKLDMITESHVAQAQTTADFLEKADPGNSYVPMLRGFAPGSAKIGDFLSSMKPALERSETLRARMQQIKEQGRIRKDIAESLGKNRLNIANIKAAVTAGANKTKELNQLRDNLRGDLGRVDMAIATYQNYLETSSGAEADNVRRELISLRLQRQQMSDQMSDLHDLEVRSFGNPTVPTKDRNAIAQQAGQTLILGPKYRKYRATSDMPKALQAEFVKDLNDEVSRRLGEKK